jgi:hypothetical protein
MLLNTYLHTYFGFEEHNALKLSDIKILAVLQGLSFDARKLDNRV